MWMKHPFLNGSDLEPLILTHMQDGAEGESTAISWTPKWSDIQKLDKVWTVNSEAHRKPNMQREQAS